MSSAKKKSKKSTPPAALVAKKKATTVKATPTRSKKNSLSVEKAEPKKSARPKTTPKTTVRPASASTLAAKPKTKTAPRLRAKVVRPLRALVVAGEHSGDLLAADVIEQLHRSKLPQIEWFGTGGERMAAAGVELIESVDSMTIIGITEALVAWRRLKRLARQLAAEAHQRGVDFALLVDYPGFNLRLAAMLKEHNIRVIYLVSPQLWAWHYSRIESIRRNVDLMLTLFEFEKEIYQREGVAAEVIGHPLVWRISRDLRRLDPLAAARQGVVTVGLLPGSRGSEISRLLPPMVEASKMLVERYPDKVRFLSASVDSRYHETIREALVDLPAAHYYEGAALRVMESSDILLIASGTATMEAAWLQTPMVILYRVGWFNFLFGSLVMRNRFIGMPNLLAREQVALELLQSEVRAENIFTEACRLIDDGEYRQSVESGLSYVRKQLGSGNPAARAATAIEVFLSSTATTPTQSE